MNFFTKRTRISGGEEEIIGYLKLGKMTVGEEMFRQIFASNAPRGSDNTSNDRSTLRCVEIRAI